MARQLTFKRPLTYYISILKRKNYFRKGSLNVFNCGYDRYAEKISI